MNTYTDDWREKGKGKHKITIFREEGILALVFFKLLVFVDGRKPEKSPLD